MTWCSRGRRAWRTSWRCCSPAGPRPGVRAGRPGRRAAAGAADRHRGAQLPRDRRPARGAPLPGRAHRRAGRVRQDLRDAPDGGTRGAPGGGVGDAPSGGAGILRATGRWARAWRRSGRVRGRGARAALARRSRGGAGSRGRWPGTRPRWSSPGSQRRRRARGRGAVRRGISPGCTRPGPDVRCSLGRASSPGCRWQQRRRGRRGPGGTDATGCCPTRAAPGTPGSLTADGRPADRDRGRPRRQPGRAARAAQPHPRRLLVRERAVVRRPGVADRPGGPRRAPGDRPGHAGAVRCAVPVPDRRLLRGGRAAGDRAGRTGCRCTSCTPCSCTCACSARATGLPRWMRPGPRWPWRPDTRPR